MSNKPVQLTSTEVVPGRPFTIPEGSVADLATLQYMAQTLCRIMMQSKAFPDQPRPLILFLEEVGGRFHRVVLSRPERLLTPSDLTVVGFCGQKRPGVDRGPVDTIDEELISELPRHTDLLSYSTLQLESGNSCNLVLFSRPEGVSHWAGSAKHAQAIRLSPQYYTVVRLHNAILPGGLMSDNRLVLIRTRYFDFQEEPPWQAVREINPPPVNIGQSVQQPVA